MATSFICPFCRAMSAFSIAWRWDTAHAPGLPTSRRVAAIQCQNAACRRVLGAVLDSGDIVEWYPRHIGGKDFPDVPDYIASTADEAHKCLSVGAHRGAIALARAVVEATAKDHGIEKGMLDKKIEQLAENGIISAAMKDAADEIRFAGNEVAHGDLAEEPITKEDSEEVLTLMDAILTRVYQEPKQVERVRQRRQERKGDS